MSISEDDFIKAAENGELNIVNQAIDQRVNVNCIGGVSRGVSVVSRTPLGGASHRLRWQLPPYLQAFLYSYLLFVIHACVSCWYFFVFLLSWIL